MASIYDYMAANQGVITPWGIQSPKVSYTQYTPEEASATFEQIRRLPEYQAQQAGIGEIQGQLERLKSQPVRKAPAGWLKPLLALADTETGSKLLAGYDDTDYEQKRNEMIMKYQDALAMRQKQAADTLMSGLGRFKSGVTTEKDVGLTPKEREQFDIKKAEVQLRADIEREKIAAQRAKGAGKAKPTALDIEVGKGVGKGLLENAEAVTSQGIRDLETVISDIKKNKVDTGFLSNIGRKAVDVAGGSTKLQEVADKVASVNLPGMKQNFPGAISNYESQKWEQLNFKPGGSEKDNIDRLERKVEILKAFEKKRKIVTDYYTSNNNSMAGFDYNQLRQFDWVDPSDSGGAGTQGAGGLSAEKSKRLQELRAKQAAGKLGK